MIDAVVMCSGAVIYAPSVIKSDSAIQNLIGRWIHIQRETAK
jgi:hypothetical protein